MPSTMHDAKPAPAGRYDFGPPEDQRAQTKPRWRWGGERTVDKHLLAACKLDRLFKPCGGEHLRVANLRYIRVEQTCAAVVLIFGARRRSGRMRSGFRIPPGLGLVRWCVPPQARSPPLKPTCGQIRHLNGIGDGRCCTVHKQPRRCDRYTRHK